MMNNTPIGAETHHESTETRKSPDGRNVHTMLPFDFTLVTAALSPGIATMSDLAHLKMPGGL